MLELAVLLMIAIAAAAATALWAWHDHVVTHPGAARPGNRVERIVGRWERLAVRAVRAVPGARPVSR